MYDENTCDEIINVLTYLTANKFFVDWFISNPKLLSNIISHKNKHNALILLNLSRNENFQKLPGNNIQISEQNEYSNEEINELKKLYQTIPGYEYITDVTNYTTEENSHIIRKKLVNEFSVIDLIDNLLKPGTEYSESIASEIVLNFSEENELKCIFIQHGYLKKMANLYHNSKNIVAKINFAETIARLLINTNPSLSEFQVEECAIVLLEALKYKDFDKFLELFHFEGCMALSYLAIASTNADELYYKIL